MRKRRVKTRRQTYFLDESFFPSFALLGTAKKSILSQCFDKDVPPTTTSFNPEQEIEDYVNYDFSLVDHDADDIDVLQFWREHQAYFLTLGSIARRIFSIPTTNTTIERLFSASKITISERRTKLGQEKLNELMFLQKHLSLLKQLEDADAETVQLKRSISISTATNIGGQTNDAGVEQSFTIQSKKLRNGYEQEVSVLDQESSSEFDDVDLV